MKRRAVLVRVSTGEPIDPSWTPTIEEAELREGNARMEHNNLGMRWIWLDTLAALGGALALRATEHSDAAVSILSAGSGG